MNQEMHEGEGTNEELPKASSSADPPQTLESTAKLDSPQSPHSTPRAVDHPLTKMFFGADGLRPIWRVLLYLAMGRGLWCHPCAVRIMIEESGSRFLWIVP